MTFCEVCDLECEVVKNNMCKDCEEEAREAEREWRESQDNEYSTIVERFNDRMDLFYNED